MMPEPGHEASTPRPRRRQRIRSGRRSPAEREHARHLAHVWTVWLRDVVGLSINQIAKALQAEWTMAAAYLAGIAVPFPRTLPRIRAASAEHYPGGIDDERWEAGPEPGVAPARPQPAARVRLPLAPRDPEAPRTRGECPEERPCPWFGCRHHMSLRLSAAGKPVVLGASEATGDWEATEAALLSILDSDRPTCSLDLAERAHSLDEIGKVFGVTRERVRQIERVGMAALRASRLREHAL